MRGEERGAEPVQVPPEGHTNRPKCIGTQGQCIWSGKGEMEMIRMGFRHQGVKWHHSLQSRTLSGKPRESNRQESPGLLCPAPPWCRAPVAFDV